MFINPDHVVTLVIKESAYDGAVQVLAQTKLLTASGDTQDKVLAKISLKDVKNSPFFDMNGEGSKMMYKPAFCENVEKISDELGIIINFQQVGTTDKENGFVNQMVFYENFEGFVDTTYPEWEASFIKQVQRVAQLLDGTVIEEEDSGISHNVYVGITCLMVGNPVAVVRVFKEKYKDQKYISTTWISTNRLEGLSKKPFLAKFGEYKEGEIIEVDFEFLKSFEISPKRISVRWDPDISSAEMEAHYGDLDESEWTELGEKVCQALIKFDKNDKL